MTSPQPPQQDTRCYRFPAFGPGQRLHPEGGCQCFTGGPAPVLAHPAATR